jgi:hypothetical protein
MVYKAVFPGLPLYVLVIEQERLGLAFEEWSAMRVASKSSRSSVFAALLIPKNCF